MLEFNMMNGGEELILQEVNYRKGGIIGAVGIHKNDWQQAFIFVVFGLIFFCEFFVGIRNFRQYVLWQNLLHSMS